MTNKEQLDAVTDWQKNTFKQSTALSKIAHLREEIEELNDDIEKGNPDRRLEFADCFILLMGAAASDGMSFDDVVNAIDEKMKINLSRQWGSPDENGVVKHVEN